MMNENQNEFNNILKKSRAHEDTHGPHPSVYHASVTRGFGFAVIDPGALANAFGMGDAILQFIHEASLDYALFVLADEPKLRKSRRGKNNNKANILLDKNPETIVEKRE